MTNRIHFTIACFKQAWFEGLAEATTKAMGLAHAVVSTKKGRLSTAGAAAAYLGLRSGSALAGTTDPGAANCGSVNGSGTASDSIVTLFQRIGMLLYIIGGVFALVCFAGAALMFMSSGNNSARADKAMKWAKNTVIGLIFLAGGFFFRSVIVNFVGQTGSVVNGGAANNDANSNLTNSCIPK